MTTKKRANYINNRDLLEQVIKSKKENRMTDELAHMLILLCQRYASKSNFANYTYNSDMQGFAMLMLVRTWNAFDPAKSENPFAFFTQCIKNSFIQFLNQERRQRDIRDEMLVTVGLSPSYSYQSGDSSSDAEEIREGDDTFDSTQSMNYDEDEQEHDDTQFIPY